MRVWNEFDHAIAVNLQHQHSQDRTSTIVMEQKTSQHTSFALPPPPGTICSAFPHLYPALDLRHVGEILQNACRWMSQNLGEQGELVLLILAWEEGFPSCQFAQYASK